jgi:putative hydrolase of HD superfamily
MVALICLSIPSKINKDLCSNYLIIKGVKIALLHDLAEVVVGDITPLDGVPKELKKKMEEEAFRSMIEDLDPEVKSELHSIYEQYEKGTSEEA